MTPEDILRNAYNEFREAELELGRKKVKVMDAYKVILRGHAMNKNWDEFDSVTLDACRDLGDSFLFAVASIETLYNRNDG